MKENIHYNSMLVKAGLLADGIYFPPAVLDDLKDRTTEGTGLFKYHEKPTAPNELHVSMSADQIWRVEVRQVNAQERTPFHLISDQGNLILVDSQSQQQFAVQVPKLPSWSAPHLWYRHNYA